MTTQDATTAQQHRLAAERAAVATLWDEAVREYEAALSLIASGEAQGEDEAALLTALGSCYWNLAEARTAWRTLRRAISLYRDRGDGIGMARATGEILRIWGPPERHRAMADEALAALGDADPYLRAVLLFRRTWLYDDDFDEVFAEVMRIAEEHGFEDLLAARTQLESRRAFDEGRLDEAIPLNDRAHDLYARSRAFDQASGVLRGGGFATMAQGRLDQGAGISRRALEYARQVHLSFSEQLALMDLAGEAFARADFARCRDLIDHSPGTTDFRADLYRMWIVELCGDSDAALRLLISPERGGGAPTALSQTHCANAGVLFHAGNHDGATRALKAWADVAREGKSFSQEVPPIADCLVALGDEKLVREVHGALQEDVARPAPTVYCTLQGRAIAPARGAVALRLGLIDEAERWLREGLAWCGRERVPIDAGLCHAGLADVARARGDDSTADGHLASAASIFEQHDARLWLDRLIKPRR